MNPENLIHIRLKHEEALQSKKDLLTSEMDLLKITKRIKQYRTLRTEELQTKLKLHRKIGEMLTSMKKLQKILPLIKIPKLLKNGEEFTEHEEIKAKIKQKHEYDDIEIQLQEIQGKLKGL